jgi:hypothetical protein
VRTDARCLRSRFAQGGSGEFGVSRWFIFEPRVNVCGKYRVVGLSVAGRRGP